MRTRSLVSGLMVLTIAAALAVPALAQPIKEVKLLAPDGATFDFFGIPVAVDGDLVISGAASDDDAGSRSGSVYVFRRDGDDWSDEAKLTADDAGASDQLGFWVDTVGGLVVAGAVGDDDAAANSGAAYVFEYDGADWSQTAKLKASDPSFRAGFGARVATDGNRLVVSASLESSTHFRGGAVYVFRRDGAVWSEEAKLVPNDIVTDLRFGSDQVDVQGDTVIVGASRADGGGAIYVFEHDIEDGWTQTAKLTGDDTASGDGFGTTAAISGDTIVAGAPFDDDVFDNSGSAYVFERGGDGWEQTAKLHASDKRAGAFFGRASIEGGVIAVGASSAAPGGAVYLFVERGRAWAGPYKITPSDTDGQLQFGRTNGISGGLLVAGAHLDDDVAVNAGAAYVYDLTNLTRP